MSTLTTGQISVGTTPTEIVAALTGRTLLMLSKNGGAEVFIGPDDTISPSTGFAWSGEAQPLALPIDGALFGIVVGDGSNPTDVVVSWAQVGP